MFAKGEKGELKASGKVFEVVDADGDNVTIRFKGERLQVVLTQRDLAISAKSLEAPEPDIADIWSLYMQIVEKYGDTPCWACTNGNWYYI